jgi:hypothetical protein
MGRRVVYIRPQGYLPLTAAWKTATSETDTIILNALNTREAAWIANGLTSKITAQYPMVGGTSTKHAFNFMNTALYNLTFNGFWSHSGTGALPNGTNAYATTGINASTVFTQNDNHAAFYSRTNATGASRCAIGSYTGGGANTYGLQLKTSANNAAAFNASNVLTQYALAANTDSQGFYLMNKTSSAIGGLTLDKNGTQIAANTIAITTNSYPNVNVLISALTVTSQFDNKECAGVYLGLGLTAGERGLLEDIENQFQTDLGRNVY